MKIVIDLPEEVVEWFKERAFIPIKYYTEVEEAMEKAEPLSEILEKLGRASEKTNMESYFDGQAYGWEEGRKALIDDIKGEINEELKDAESGSEKLGMYSALRIIENHKKDHKGD